MTGTATANQPLKGAHLVFNDEVTTWLAATLTVAQGIYRTHLEALLATDEDDPDGQDLDGMAILKDLEDAGWTRVDDKFGKKAYVSTPHPAGRGHYGELRVGVVLIKSKLSLDIRLWGEY